MIATNKMIVTFEPYYISNDWGNFVDIENYKYDIHFKPLHLVKKKYNYYDNVNNANNTNNANIANEDKIIITNIIFKVSSTTFVTILLAYFAYKAI